VTDDEWQEKWDALNSELVTCHPNGNNRRNGNHLYALRRSFSATDRHVADGANVDRRLHGLLSAD